MINSIEALLKELSPLIGLDLHLDIHDVCCLQAGESLQVQIEQGMKSNIFIAAFLTEVGPGKFREEVLKEGLKANAQLFPGGILCFNNKNGQLAVYKMLPQETLNGSKLLEELSTLIDYASQWQSALKDGKTAPVSIGSKSSAPSPFGLKP